MTGQKGTVHVLCDGGSPGGSMHRTLESKYSMKRTLDICFGHHDSGIACAASHQASLFLFPQAWTTITIRGWGFYLRREGAKDHCG